MFLIRFYLSINAYVENNYNKLIDGQQRDNNERKNPIKIVLRLLSNALKKIMKGYINVFVLGEVNHSP